MAWAYLKLSGFRNVGKPSLIPHKCWEPLSFNTSNNWVAVFDHSWADKGQCIVLLQRKQTQHKLADLRMLESGTLS